jgi:hypothetical protein
MLVYQFFIFLLGWRVIVRNFCLAFYAHAVNASGYCDLATASEVKQFFCFCYQGLVVAFVFFVFHIFRVLARALWLRS